MPVYGTGYRRSEGQLRCRYFRWFTIARAGVRLTARSQWLKRFLLVAWLPLLYWGFYHLVGVGDQPLASYQDEQKKVLARGANVEEAALITMAQDPAAVAQGQSLFVDNCAQCHEKNASGNIGPNATWNVLNYGRIRNNVRVQDAVFQQALNNYRQSVLSAAGEVEDAMVGLERSRVQAGLLKQGVAASQRALDLAMLQYKEGDTSFQRVLDSTQALSQQQDQHIQAVGNISTNAIALYKALGGGWKNTGRKTLLTDETRNAMKQRTNWGKLLPDSHPSNEDTSGAAKTTP